MYNIWLVMDQSLKLAYGPACRYWFDIGIPPLLCQIKLFTNANVLSYMLAT